MRTLFVWAQDENTAGSESYQYRNFPTDWWGEYTQRDQSWFASDEQGDQNFTCVILPG